MPSLHALQWAVSHNSYNTKQQRVVANMHFDPGRFYDLGFRGIELDIVQNGVLAEWCVSHGGSFDPRFKLLSSYLADLRDWSAASRANGDDNAHELMFVHLDCKEYTVTDAFPEQLDNYIRAALGDQPLYTPKDMIKPGKDLMQSAMEGGWPDPDDLRGHFIFVLSGEREPKEKYAMQNPAKRVCFADLGKSFQYSTSEGTRVISNSDIVLLANPLRFGKWCASKAGLLWRVYVAEDEDEFKSIARAGAHMIAADTCFSLPQEGYWPNPLAPAPARVVERTSRKRATRLSARDPAD